jgi:hypothetical protein
MEEEEEKEKNNRDDTEETHKRADDSSDQLQAQDSGVSPSYSLFAFPGECNFSGAKYPLEFVARYHGKRDEKNRCVGQHMQVTYAAL